MASLIRAGIRFNRMGLVSHRLMTTQTSSVNSKPSEESAEKIQISFIEQGTNKKTIIKTEPGKSLYDVVMENNMDFDGFGSCGATLCCTTCHLILNENDYNKLSPPTEEELNMLDLADGLCDTSRLGCQVVLPKGMKSLEVEVPANLTDARL